MYYIDNYKYEAIQKIIPYLIEFPQIVKTVEMSAERYQAIEDVLWKIADNFKVSESRGIFLNAHANNEVVDFIYTDKADDAFTYGTDKPLYQAYGTGHYYSQASYISGVKKTVSEDKTIRAVQAKIIQNNTNCTVEDLIESLKLLYNAKHVRVLESNPLRVSIMLSGNELELSSSGNYENIKKMLPATVSLNNIYVNPEKYDLFVYDENSAYGDNRYPIIVYDTVDLYNYISLSTILDSEFEEYVVTNHDKLDNDEFITICGEFTKFDANSTICSSNDGTNSFAIIIDDNGYIALKNNNNVYPTAYLADESNYTINLYNSGTQLKLYVSNKINMKGKALSEDYTYITNVIQNYTPDIIIDNYTTINAPIYINCFHNTDNTNSNFADFLYYAVMFGNMTNATEYYATCFGEKQMWFNCIENTDHLYINTNNPLISNIMAKQSYYNYKATHSNGKYLYLDGKSGIDYYVSDSKIDTNLKSVDISFEICSPIDLQDGIIASDFIGDGNIEYSEISVTSDGGIALKLDTLLGLSDEEVDIYSGTYETLPGVVIPNEYCKFKVQISNNEVTFYKNNEILSSFTLFNIINDIPQTLKIGYNRDLTSFYKGFIRNFNVEYIDNEDNVKEINIPFIRNLKDTKKEIEYTNFGARFLTVPQLISDTTSTDLYGNTLIGKR